MSTYYVSPDGDNADNGLGPDASDGTNRPWLTIDYAVDNMASGDTVYIAPGIYREAVSVGVSPSAETFILGDPLNAQGFKDGSGNRLSAGRVVLTGFTTDDVTTSSTVPLNLNAKNYLTVEKLEIQAGNADAFSNFTGTNLTFRDCHISSHISILSTQTIAADTNKAVTFERCIIACFGAGSLLDWTLTKSAISEYSIGLSFLNCFLFSARASNFIVFRATGASAYYGGGSSFTNCLISTGGAAIIIVTGHSTTYPATVKNCMVIGGLTAATNGEGVDTYSMVTGSRSNWTAGTGSVVIGSRNPHFALGQDWLFGLPKGTQPPFGLLPQSGLLGFGNDTSPPATDMLGVTKPSGSGVVRASGDPSIGPFECYNYGTKDTSTKDASDAALKMIGPGTQFIRVPVNASSTTFSIKVRYQSTTYGGTNYPQIILLANGEIGVTTETETATVSASDAWETLTFTAQTPLAKGYVTFQLINRTNDADGVCWFDTLTRA